MDIRYILGHNTSTAAAIIVIRVHAASTSSTHSNASDSALACQAITKAYKASPDFAATWDGAKQVYTKTAPPIAMPGAVDLQTQVGLEVQMPVILRTRAEFKRDFKVPPEELDVPVAADVVLEEGKKEDVVIIRDESMPRRGILFSRTFNTLTVPKLKLEDNIAPRQAEDWFQKLVSASVDSRNKYLQSANIFSKVPDVEQIQGRASKLQEERRQAEQLAVAGMSTAKASASEAGITQPLRDARDSMLAMPSIAKSGGSEQHHPGRPGGSRKAGGLKRRNPSAEGGGQFKSSASQGRRTPPPKVSRTTPPPSFSPSARPQPPSPSRLPMATSSRKRSSRSSRAAGTCGSTLAFCP